MHTGERLDAGCANAGRTASGAAVVSPKLVAAGTPYLAGQRWPSAGGPGKAEGRGPFRPNEESVIVGLASTSPDEKSLKPEAQSLLSRQSPLPAGRRMFLTLLAGALLMWLIAWMQVQRGELFGHFESILVARAHCLMAQAFGMQHKTAQAIAEYTEALRLVPFYDVALNDLALIRAASPQAEFRNGPEAVQLAERACKMTDYQMPMCVATLAAAYAEAGRFDDAVGMAKKARALTLAKGENELAEKYSKLMEHYNAHKSAWEGDGN